MDQYEVRSWSGWRRHVTLAMLAHAYVAVLRKNAIGGRGPARSLSADLLPLIVPEVRRMLWRMAWARTPAPEAALRWSRW